MLREIGLESIDQLFEDIPEEIHIDGLNMESAMSEQDLRAHMVELSEANKPASKMLSFLGGGLYHHYIPAVVRSVMSRTEF
jgi:glycine dehydrogenase subunit 1